MSGFRDSPLARFAWPALVALVAIAAAMAGVWLVAIPLAIAAATRGADLARAGRP